MPARASRRRASTGGASAGAITAQTAQTPAQTPNMSLRGKRMTGGRSKHHKGPNKRRASLQSHHMHYQKQQQQQQPFFYKMRRDSSAMSLSGQVD